MRSKRKPRHASIAALRKWGRNMAKLKLRKHISSPDITHIGGLAPLANVDEVSGIRVHDVGQGDSIAILDQHGNPVLQLDYGGRQGHPFSSFPGDRPSDRMPISPGRLLMISHWDEDHWCSARHAEPAKAAKWLVPRQITSPRAVKFSAELDDIRCIPPDYTGRGFRFVAKNGDSVWWEKIAPGPDAFAREEDCNRTGVALSVVKAGSPNSVILLPGDAPFDRVGHYWEHFNAGAHLEGLVAFHHGAGTHWTEGTKRLLRQWSNRAHPLRIVFSCSDPNAYDHPKRDNYSVILNDCAFTTTADLRDTSGFVDLLF